ncbi:MAG: hypothetical protein HOP15_05650 [Planctomycetes bacterium]|nr:hypothetical protein [Planctomycetota bacterium]
MTTDRRLAPLDERHPENRGVLAYLARGGPAHGDSIARPSSVPDAYQGCGCHPDVVERLWDVLGRELPRAARALVFRTPALVHARAGIVLAVGLGTTYALRLSAAALSDPASTALASAHSYRTAGERLDLVPWGPLWRFGAYLTQEPAWLAAAAAEFDA